MRVNMTAVACAWLFAAMLHGHARAAEDFQITIARQYSDATCTSGYLLVNDDALCYALERPWQGNVTDISSIPAGTYGTTLRYDHADHWRIELDVPDRPHVQIHIGNTPGQTKGCILVGDGLGADLCSLTGSASAYAKLKQAFYGSANPSATPDKTISVIVRDAGRADYFAARIFNNSADVIAATRAIPDGGGYRKDGKSTGSPREIRFKDALILSKDKDSLTYCSGFTFAVAMQVADARGLLASHSVEEVKKFQQEWYGALANVPDVVERQCVVAMEHLKVGKAVPLTEAQPGDFVQFWRDAGTTNGHSVVFLRWEKDGDKFIGIRYRGSQGSTDGVGDHLEYFDDVQGKKGSIKRDRTYVGRLNDATH